MLRCLGPYAKTVCYKRGYYVLFQVFIVKLDNKSQPWLMLLTNTRYIQILTGGFNSFYLKSSAHVKKRQCNYFNIQIFFYSMPREQLEMPRIS